MSPTTFTATLLLVFLAYLVPFSTATECKRTRLGTEFLGRVSVTKPGKTCQPWASQSPQSHDMMLEKFPDDVNSLDDIGNACRNPDNTPGGPWCYTTDPDTRWELCDVPLCECKKTRLGTEYLGQVKVTTTGKTCQAWASQSPQSHTMKLEKFPDNVKSLDDIGNDCRNPDNTPGGPWCYTTDPDARWEFCDVPLCECKKTGLGSEYLGQVNVTTTGKTCQAWASQSPQSHTMALEKFPDNVKSLDNIGNNCRNPDITPGGPWCYTTDPDTRWGFCDVPLCDSI